MGGVRAREDEIDRLDGHDRVAVERVEIEHQNVGGRADAELAGPGAPLANRPLATIAESHAPRSMTLSKPQPP